MIFLAAVTLSEKVLQPFWHVDVISHCAKNGLVFWQKLFVSCQHTFFEKTVKRESVALILKGLNWYMDTFKFALS